MRAFAGSRSSEIRKTKGKRKNFRKTLLKNDRSLRYN